MSHHAESRLRNTLHRHERHVLAPVVRGRRPAQQHARAAGGDLRQTLLESGHHRAGHGGRNWLSAAAPGAREAGSALFASVFNAAIALGAFTGGRTADGLGATAVLCVGGGLALTALPAVVRAGRPGGERRPETAGAPAARERA
ncbi:hypothetical protein [Streptomyces venetus]|uniref:hypothetical protein n=1 Tax=Streptomyces venetus TaxID=1701086 RepID=UPI003CD08903